MRQIQTPSVNILIFTYNQESLIKETLDSVINQSYENITKIVVSDDGSNDGTPQIIMDYSLKNPLIVPVLAKNNKGIAYNMNRAIKRADGDYISFLDGDDLMHPHKIEKQVDFLNANPDLVACASDMDVVETVTGEVTGKFSELINFKRMKGSIDIKSIFDPSLLLCPSSIMYRREVIPEEGMDIRLKYWYEFLFIVEVLVKGDIGYLDKVLGSYRLHEANVTSSSDFKKFGLENSLIVYSIILARYPVLHSQVKKRKTITYLAKIIENIQDNDNEKAKKLSKALISEGCYIKGSIAYLVSFVLSGNWAKKLFKNRKFLKIFLKLS